MGRCTIVNGLLSKANNHEAKHERRFCKPNAYRAILGNMVHKRRINRTITSAQSFDCNSSLQRSRSRLPWTSSCHHCLPPSGLQWASQQRVRNWYKIIKTLIVFLVRSKSKLYSPCSSLFNGLNIKGVCPEGFKLAANDMCYSLTDERVLQVNYTWFIKMTISCF